MLRPTGSRTLLRSLTKPASAPTSLFPRCSASSLSRPSSRRENLLSRQSNPLALSTFRQPTSLIRYASGRVPGTTQRPDKEAQFAAQQLPADPEVVSTSSSTHPILGEVGAEEKEEDVDMMAGLRHDLVRLTRALDITS